MAGKKLEYKVEVDASSATADLNKLGQAGEKAGQQIADGFKDVGSKSEAAFDKVIGNLKQVTEESKRTIQVVGTIGDKFGEGFDPESTAQFVNSLRKAGVEFDTIESRAEELATTMRELQDVRIDAGGGMAKVGDEAHAAGGHVNELSDSARGAHSALANMIGNSAQDMGALGGIAGSAGVAIGQMAEYASDAALGGEALGASLASMAAVAGPIAALSAGLLAVQGIMKLIHRDDGLTAAQVAAVSAALADQIGILDDYQSAVSTAFGQGAADTIDVFTEAVLKSIEATKGDDFITGLETALGRLGVVRQQFGEVAAQSQQDQHEWFLTLLNLHGIVGPLADEIADYYTGLTTGSQATTDWALANPELADSFNTVSLALGDARKNNNAATQDFLDNQASISKGSKALVDAAIASAAAQAEATGTQFSWNDALKAYIDLQQRILQVGVAISAVGTEQADAASATADAIGETKKALEDETGAVADGIKAWKDHNTAVQEAVISIGDAIDKIPDIAAAFDTEFGKADDVISGLAFDVDFKPAMQKAMDDLDGFEPDMRTFVANAQAILNGDDIEIFGNVRADDAKFLEVLGNATTLLQEGTANAFAQGGTDSAQAFVDAFVTQFAEAHHMTKADVYALMQLPADGSVTTLIKPEVEQAHADQARSILDTLAGVNPGDERTARIHVALETDQIDGDIAYIASLLLAHDELGVNVTPQLAAFTPAQIAQAQATIDGSGAVVTIPAATGVPDTSGTQAAIDDAFPGVVVPVGTHEDRSVGETQTTVDELGNPITPAVIVPKSDSLGQMQELIDFVARARTVNMNVKADNAGAISAILDHVARPSESDRPAYIIATPQNVAETDRQLDNLAARRDAYIYVHTIPVGGAAGAGGGGLPPDDTSRRLSTFGVEDEVSVNPLAGESVAVASFGSPVSIAGTLTAPVVHNHVTIQAAVIGSRFDVQRAVTKALRSAQRLNGGRAA